MTAQRRYLDLRFDLRYRTARRIDVALTVSGADTGDVPVVFDQKKLDRAMAKVDDRTISEEELYSLGTQVGEMLIPDGPIRTLFTEMTRPDDHHDAVRLRLVPHDAILARVPWELAYVQRQAGERVMNDFLVLDPDVSMVRHPPLVLPDPTLGGFDPRRLRLVIATANASRLAPLDLTHERTVIETALSKVTVPGVTIEVVALVEDATLERLAEALDDGADLFHFAGHGMFRETEVDAQTGRPTGEGGIALQGERGRMQLLDAGTLASHLERGRFRVAVLGACDGGRVDGVRDWSGIAPALIRQGMAAVVAMQFPIQDRHAIGFSRAFYGALAKGAAIDDAVSLGRQAIADVDSGSSQFAVPVLYMRSDDGAIFTADTAQAAEEPETTVFRGVRPSPWLTEIFGRDEEQRQLADLLADPGTRVVTVVGREGIGKSALVCVTMARLEDGTWSGPEPGPRVAGIIHHSVRDTAFTLDKLFGDFARVVGGPDGEALDRLWANTTVPIEEKVDQFLHALAGRFNVVVLEDFETLLDDDGQISDPRTRTLFERAVLSPWHTRLVLVSRVPLRFPEAARQFDARVELVDGLEVPDGIAMLRALDRNDIYRVRDATDDKLTRAVERVHGVPGALRMIFRILDEAPGRSLDDALGTFYTDQIVRELLERGYEGLAAGPDGDAMRRVMQALAVFRTPIGRDALVFLLEPQHPASQVGAALDRLARMHMVDIDRGTGSITAAPIDQDYAYAQIPPTGPAGVTALERRAADWFASVRLPSSEWRTTEGLDPQLREFDHRMRAGDPDGASAVLATIEVDELVWRGRGELARWYRDQLEGHLTDERQLALHAYAVGQIRLVLGPLDSALERLEDAGTRARALGDERLEAYALAGCGEALRRLGRLAEAAGRLGDAIPMYQRLHDADNESSVRLSLSLTMAYLGDGPGALAEGGRAMALADTSGDALMRARADDSLSLGYLVIGDLDAALAHADASAHAYEAAGQPEPLGYVVNVRGMVLLAKDRAAEAVVEFERVDKAGAAVQQPRISGLGLFNLARARRIFGDPTGAWDAARGAEAALGAVGSLEASAAGALARSLKASIDGDAATEVTELLACARDSMTSADLHAPLDLAEEVDRRATEAGTASKAVRKDARALARDLRARLAKRA